MPTPTTERRRAETLTEVDLHRWQARTLVAAENGVRAIGIAGGFGSGKSFLAAYLAAFLAVQSPGIKICVGMSTAKNLRTIHRPMISKLLGPIPKHWDDANGAFVLHNGTDEEARRTDRVRADASCSQILLRHLDMPGDPNLGEAPVEGNEFSVFILDECQQIHPGYWRFAIARTRSSDVGISLRVFIGLPINTWWCAEVEKAGGLVQRPRTAANRAHLREGYEDDLRANMTEAEADAFLCGRELAIQGGCYRDYRAASEAAGGHWTDWAPKPSEYAETRFVLCGDLGVRYPHFGLWAEDVERGRWVMLRDYAPDNVGIPQVATMMRRECLPRPEWLAGAKRYGPSWAARIFPVDELRVDAAVRARMANGQEQAQAWALPDGEGFGMYPVWNKDPSKSNITTGIGRVNLALMRHKLAFHLPMMVAGAVAKGRTVAKCMVGYRMDDYGTPIKDNINDHGADMVRYFVMGHLWQAVSVDPKSGGFVAPPEDRGEFWR